MHFCVLSYRNIKIGKLCLFGEGLKLSLGGLKPPPPKPMPGYVHGCPISRNHCLNNVEDISTSQDLNFGDRYTHNHSPIRVRRSLACMTTPTGWGKKYLSKDISHFLSNSLAFHCEIFRFNNASYTYIAVSVNN